MPGRPSTPVSQRLFRNFAILFVANVLGQVLFLFALVQVARTVGVVAFGLWNLAQAWMMYLFRAGEMGLEVAGIRSIATSDRRGERTTVWNVLTLRIGLAFLLVTAMGGAVLLGIVPEGSGPLILVFAVAVFPVAILLEWVFEAHQEIPVVGAARILKGAIFGILVLLFVHGPDQILAGAWYYVLSLLIPSVMVAVVGIRRHALMPPTFDRRAAVLLARAAFPIGAATILSQYTLFVGTVLAGYLVTQERLGLYTAGHRLVIFLWAYGIVTSNRVILPRLSLLFEQSKEEFSLFVKKYFRLLTLVSLPVCVIGYLGGSEVIRILYGPAYAESAPIFSILSVALALAVVRSVLEVGLIAAHRQDLFVKGMIGLAIAYTALTVLGILKWDIVGAAWAATIAEFLYAAYLVVVFRFVSVADFVGMCWKPVLAGAASLGLLIALGAKALPLVVIGGLGSYVLLLYLFRELSRRDVELLLQVVGLRRGG